MAYDLFIYIISTLKSFMLNKVGWVTGSNPEQMYALICRNCCEHNGLASKEEFDYLEWRCAYCHFLNKARYKIYFFI